MEFQDRQFLRLGKRSIAFVVVAALASLMLASAGPAQAKRMSGTKGADRIVLEWKGGRSKLAPGQMGDAWVGSRAEGLGNGRR